MADVLTILFSSPLPVALVILGTICIVVAILGTIPPVQIGPKRSIALGSFGAVLIVVAIFTAWLLVPPSVSEPVSTPKAETSPQPQDTIEPSGTTPTKIKTVLPQTTSHFTPTPTPGLTPSPTNTPRPSSTPIRIERGEMLYFEDFNEPVSDWGQRETSERSMVYRDGTYSYAVRLGSKQFDWYPIYLPENEIFSDFVLDVDVTLFNGPVDGDSEYGITFREQRNLSDLHRYHFLIDARGGYVVFKQVGTGEGIGLAHREHHPSIKKGQATNHLTIVAEGQKISVFANNEWLETVYDSSMDRGVVGFNIGAMDDIEVRFDNLAIYELAK